MTTEVVHQDLIQLPRAALAGKELKGFGIDIGGTLIKVAYPTYDNDTLYIHLVTYRKDQIEAALTSLKEKLPDLSQDGALLYSTGVGCNQFEKLINQTLGVKLKNCIEMELNSKATRFLVENLALEGFTFPPSRKAEEYIEQERESFKKMTAKLEVEQVDMDLFGLECEKNSTKDGVKETPDPATRSRKFDVDDVFPCLICMVGSGAFYCVTGADGRTCMIDINTSCGRMLLGLGSLLTGAKTFDELIGLAEEGDNSTVDMLCRHVKNRDVDDLYSMLPDWVPIYCFGQAVGKDIADFPREDLAAGLVSQLAQNIAQSCHLANMMSDVKMVFFAGSVCTRSELIRDQISTFYGSKSAMNFKGIHRDFYFLKHGAYIGAIGALLKSRMDTSSAASASASASTST